MERTNRGRRLNSYGLSVGFHCLDRIPHEFFLMTTVKHSGAAGVNQNDGCRQRGVSGCVLAFACTHPRQTNLRLSHRSNRRLRHRRILLSPLPNQFSSVICKEAQSLLKMFAHFVRKSRYPVSIEDGLGLRSLFAKDSYPQEGRCASVFGSKCLACDFPTIVDVVGIQQK